LWLAAGVGVGALLTGSIAYATIPGSNGVIHGCYKNSGGALRVIDPSQGGTCVSTETALQWNEQGPRGKRGKRGPAGATHAYAAYAGLSVFAGAATQIALVNVPAGNYTVWATGTAVGEPGYTNKDHCQLRANGSGQFSQVEMSPTWASLATEPYSMVGAASLSTSGTIGLYCFGYTASDDGAVDNNYLLATPVQAIN
jgi:hypothetical protein